MKKIIISIVAIVTIAAAGYGAYYYFTPQKKSGLEEFFPKDTFFYAESSDIQAAWTRFFQTSFGQAVQKIDWASVLDENQQKAKDKFFAELADPSVQSMLKTFFSKETAIGINPSNSSVRLVDLVKTGEPLNDETLKTLGSSFILATRVGPDVKTAEFIAQTFHVKAENIEIHPSEYQGVTINVVSSAEIPFQPAYYLKNNILVIGLTQEGVQKSIDALKNPQNSLVADNLYKTIQQEFYPNAFLNVFVNLSASFKSLESQIKEVVDYAANGGNINNLENVSERNLSAAQNNYEMLAQKMQGFEALAISGGWDSAVRWKTSVLYDQNKMDESAEPFYSCLSKNNSSLQFVPSGTLVSYWNGCFPGEALVGQINARLPDGRNNFSVLNNFLVQIDEEFGGMIKDIKTQTSFPFPDLAVYIKAKDKTRVESLMNSLDVLKMLPKQTENYDGINLTYFRTPFGENLEPVYGFIDQFLFVAVNRNFMKELIDVKKGSKAALVKDNPEQNALLGVELLSTGLVLVDMDNFIQKFSAVVNWGDAWISKVDENQMAFLAGSEQKLTEMDNALKLAQAELDELKKQATALEEQSWKPDAQATQGAANLVEKEKINNDIALKQTAVDELIAQRKKTEQSLATFKLKSRNIEKRNMFKGKIVMPLLKALESMDALSVRSTNEKGLFTSEATFILQ